MVWTVEEGKAAERAGIVVGDVVLSVEDHIVNEIDNVTPPPCPARARARVVARARPFTRFTPHLSPAVIEPEDRP